MNIDVNKITNFIALANLAGYASGNEGSFINEADGSKTIRFTDGDWVFHDNYFGGEPYGGREVVFYQGKSVFMMVYYGRISDNNSDKEKVYSFLRQALKKFPADFPMRGPAELAKEEFLYENKWQGDIGNFSGQEKIFFAEKEVYNASYVGGLIDL